MASKQLQNCITWLERDMPQELHVLKCYACQTFQVHIVKKILKWQCKLCGEKQSLKKVYGQGSGKDCRNHVQRLNKLRGETLGSLQDDTKGNAVLEQSLSDSYAFNKPSSKWDNYLDDMASQVNDDDIQDGESQYTTEVKVFKNAKRKQKSATNGKIQLLKMGLDCRSVISPIPVDKATLGASEKDTIFYSKAASKFNVQNKLFYKEVNTLKSYNLPTVNEELAKQYNFKHSINSSSLDDCYGTLKHVRASAITSKPKAFNNSRGQILTNSGSLNNLQEKVESRKSDLESHVECPTNNDVLHVKQNELSTGTLKNDMHQTLNKATAVVNKSKWDIFCPLLETQDRTYLDELHEVRNTSVEQNCSSIYIAHQADCNINNLNNNDTKSVKNVVKNSQTQDQFDKMNLNVVKDKSNYFELSEEDLDEALNFI